MRFAVLLILLALFSANAFAQKSQRRQTMTAWHVRAKLYEPLIVSTAQRYDVDPHLLWTIAYLESRFRKDVISYKDGKPCAYGMMQFTAPTASRYGLTNPHDPRQAIDAAARYVRDLQRRFGSRGDLILAAYNAGEGTVEAFRYGKTLLLPNNIVVNPRRLRTDGIPPYEETRNYIARGAMIYRTLTRVTISASNSIDNSTQKNQQIEPPSVYTARQDSFYSLENSTQRNKSPATKSNIVARTNSLYAN